MAHTAQSEGLLGLYRGALPSLTSAVVENAVGITVQRSLRRRLAALRGEASDVRYSAATEVALGGATGVFTAVAICPFEVIKVRQQVEADSAMGAIVRRLMREDGYRGLYRGLPTVVCRDVPFNAIFYGAYESICTLLMRMGDLDAKADLAPGYIFVAGGLAGSAGWCRAAS
eukprot:1100989-Prymnesium_polylepis.1